MRYSVDDLVEKINLLEDSKEEKRQRAIKRIKRGASISLAALLMYTIIPKTSEKIGANNKDEMYYSNQLIISETEQDELYGLISREIGRDVSGNENALVLSGAATNNNLTEEEKQIIYSFIDMLEDNIHMNKKAAYDALRNVDIIYEPSGDGEHSNKIVGVYSRKENKIKIFSDDPENKVKIHELIHCIFTTPDTSKLPSFLVEGVTELLTNEYFEENPFVEDKSYPYEITMVKILADIVGSDTILETYSTGNIDILKSALKKQMKDKDINELLESIDTFFKEYEEKETIDESKLNKILIQFDEYYYHKFENADDNEEYTLYMYNRGILETMTANNSNALYVYYLMENGYYTKPYFSKKLKEEYSKITNENYLADIKIENREKIYNKVI